MFAFAFNIQQIKAEPKAWTVDDDGPADFHKIQDAINSPLVVDGDTILVRAGTYREIPNLNVWKSLTIEGEDPSVTIIDGSLSPTYVVIWIYKKDIALTVSISGFTIQNGASGIALINSSDSTISKNNVIGMLYDGISIVEGSNNTILENNVSDADHGIIVTGSNNSVIQNHVKNQKSIGICVTISAKNVKNTILSNNITNNAYGLSIGGWNNTVFNNTIASNNVDGMVLHEASHNKIEGNTIASNNRYGIRLDWSSGNAFYHNNFINNSIQVWGVDSISIWDNGYPSGGNYWSDYTDVDLYCGPDQDVKGSDGIWDHPYVIDENNQDNYPLVKPYVLGNLSVSIYTDKTIYHAGDPMRLRLYVSNPDSVKYLCFAVWLKLPNCSKYPYMHKHSVLLPIGLNYANPSFQTIALPSLPKGTYTWHAAFLERTIHKIIVEDTAEWQFN